VFLISSCLIGCEVTWRATSNAHERFAALLREHRAIPVCPEQLGGLPTPRPPSEIVGGTGEDVLDGSARVLTRDGADVTEHFLRGAQEVLRIAELVRPKLVILKERSPSCGVHWIYDGTFSGNLRSGCGVTTALLRRNGWRVVSDEEFLAGALDEN
jgi:uncharacterized protein YbbK (DUF523 family)